MRTRTFPSRDLRSPLTPKRALLLVSLATAASLLGCGWGTGAGAPEASALRPQPQQAASVTAQGTPDDWLGRVQRGLAEREYRASRSHAGLQAPNRAQNLRTYFEASGIRVHDRTAAGSPELLSLSLLGVGRGADVAPVEPGEVSHAGTRVEIRRPGLLEWYENSPGGLEQGFTIEERPEGNGPLLLELAVEGARATRRGERVILQAPTGRRLEYGALTAVDAGGRTLVARVEVPEASRLRLLVEDETAAYPVVIDPLLSATIDAQLESNQADARLGESVAGAGDVNGDGYDDVIVGAPYYDAGQSDEGAAFVFLGSTSGIADGNPANAATQLESDQAGAWLGRSVAGAGDVNADGYDDVIVGARSYDAGEISEGAAFVFLGSASGIADGKPRRAAARLQSDEPNAWLGWGVAGAGDVNGDGYDDVIVGAPGYSGGGAAFVFLGSATGIVAEGYPDNADVWLESDQVSGLLGESVAGAGDVNGDGYDDVVVGAFLYDAGHREEGAAFVFLGSASGIADGNPDSAAARLESDQENGHLGYSVAGAGDVDGDGYDDVIVGAPFYDAGEGHEEGAAFVFLGSASGVADGNPSTAASQIESDQAEITDALPAARLGESVDGAGDVNGDGYDDVIVGSPGYAGGGAALLFLGSASGIAGGNPDAASAEIVSDQFEAGPTTLEGARLGTSVAGAGDVNGDGADDVIVGAPFHDAGEGRGEGAAFAFMGGDPAHPDGLADRQPAGVRQRDEQERCEGEPGAAEGEQEVPGGPSGGEARHVLRGVHHGRPLEQDAEGRRRAGAR